MTKVCPLKPEDPGVINQEQAAPTSAGSIRRPYAEAQDQSSRTDSSELPLRSAALWANAASMRLLTLPGQTMLARPPYLAISLAKLWVRPMSPNFDAQ